MCFALKDMTHMEPTIPFLSSLKLEQNQKGVGRGSHIPRVPHHFNGGFNSIINQKCDLHKSPESQFPHLLNRVNFT